jgi:prevent-host-death family protein
MSWNIAQAKQHFSEVVKQAAEEPQLICNRNQPIAALISAEEYAVFLDWRKTQAVGRTLADDFADLRKLAAGDPEPLPDPDRFGSARVDAFMEILVDNGAR